MADLVSTHGNHQMGIAGNQISVRDHARETRFTYPLARPPVAPHPVRKATPTRWFLDRPCMVTEMAVLAAAAKRPTGVVGGQQLHDLDTKLKKRAGIGILETETEKETLIPLSTWPRNSQYCPCGRELTII